MIREGERRQMLEKAEELKATISASRQRLEATPVSEETGAFREATRALICEMERMEKNLRNMAGLGEGLQSGPSEDEGGK